jgi:hypothetical protein
LTIVPAAKAVVQCHKEQSPEKGKGAQERLEARKEILKYYTTSTHIKLAHNKTNFLNWGKNLGSKIGM